MKIIKNKLFITLLFIFFLTGCSQTGTSNDEDSQENASEQSSNLKIATFQQGTSWYVYGATVSKILRENVDGLQLDVLPYAGGIGNIKIIDKGEADLGFTYDINNYWATTGTAAYDKKYENLRGLVGGLDQYYVGVVMTEKFVKKYDITSIADIKEKEIPVRLYTNKQGSQGEYGVQQVLEAYGMDYEDIKSYGGTVEHTSWDVVKSSFQNGRIDMFSHVITRGHPTLTQIALQVPLVFIPIKGEYADKLTESSYQKAVLPANTFNGQEKDIPTVGIKTSLITSSKLSNDLAYKITKSIVENQEELKEAHEGLKNFDPKAGLDALGGMELHPGAAKYYKEKGWIE